MVVTSEALKVTRRRSLIEQLCFSSFLNRSQSSTARRAAGKQFQTRGPAAENDLSPSLVFVDELRKRLVEVRIVLEQNIIYTVTNEWRKRLRASVRAK